MLDKIQPEPYERIVLSMDNLKEELPPTPTSLFDEIEIGGGKVGIRLKSEIQKEILRLFTNMRTEK